MHPLRTRAQARTLTGRSPARGLAALGLAAAFVSFLLPASNPDIFWHLSAARRILELGAPPRADWLSSTMAGQPWVDFEWATQLLWHGLFRAFGPWGLLGLKALLLAATAGVLWKTSGLYDLSPEARSLSILAWSLAIVRANDLRPENFSLLLFCLELHWLEAGRLGRRAPGPLGQALLFALWANLHAGFVYGLALLGIYAAVEWHRGKSRKLLGRLAVSVPATLLTPYGPGLHRVLAIHWRELGELQRFIREWQRPELLDPWLAPFWCLFAAAFVAAIIRRKEIPPERLASLGLYGLSALSHGRTIPYFALLAAPLAACQLPRRRGAAALATAGLLAFFGLKVAPNLSLAEPILPRLEPAGVARFLESERDALGGHRLLNPWIWGGYLGYRLSPGYKVFSDGRYLFHPLLRPWQEALQSPEAYRRFLDRFGVELVVLERTRQLFRMGVELAGGRKAELWRPSYLLYLPKAEWALTHWDSRGMVFCRRAAFPRDWLRSHEFKAFRPDDQEAAELMVREGLLRREELEGEAKRHLKQLKSQSLSGG